jgi:hypothetical protein
MLHYFRVEKFSTALIVPKEAASRVSRLKREGGKARPKFMWIGFSSRSYRKQQRKRTGDGWDLYGYVSKRTHGFLVLCSTD